MNLCACTWQLHRRKPARRVPVMLCDVHGPAVELLPAPCCGCNCTACHSDNCCKN